MREVKENLRRMLCDNDHKRAIVYTNTARQAERNKMSLDEWLHTTNSVNGDVILIVGNTHFKVKGALATSFTASSKGSDLIQDNKSLIQDSQSLIQDRKSLIQDSKKRYQIPYLCLQKDINPLSSFAKRY